MLSSQRASAERKTIRRGLIVMSACALLVPVPAYAYVDPSVVTYAIQSIAAVVVALSAVAGVAFRRTRKAIFNMLGIDEKASGLNEPDAREIEACDRALVDEEAESCIRSAAEEAQRKSRLSWPKRLWRSLIVSVFLVYTVFVVAPVELLVSNSTDIIVDVSALWAPIIISGIVMAVVLALILSAFRGKAFGIALMVVVGLGIAAYLQSMFLNVGLPAANGTPVPWSDRDKITLVSALVWIAVIGGCVFAAVKTPRRARAIGMVVAVCLIIIQSVGVASLFMDPSQIQSKQEAEQGQIIVSEDGLFEVAPHDNIIVFVLDTMDTQSVLDVLEYDPALLDEFTGFTFYVDSTGSLEPTRYGVPSLLTGYTIRHDQDAADYLSGLYERSVFLDELADLGYDVNVYSKSASFNKSSKEYLAEHASNIRHVGENVELPIDGLAGVRIMYQCALYRDMPWILKRPFWYYTEDINIALIGNNTASVDSVTPCSFNDPLYYMKLEQRGLTVDESEATGAYRLIHLVGAHYPYVMGPDGKRALDSTLGEQVQGSFLIVSTYLQMMKALGVYDDATIIVTADHGRWEFDCDVQSYPSSPVMLVKPAQSAEEAAAPWQYSDALVSQWDVNPTIIEAAGGDVDAFEWTGTSVFEATTDPRLRYFLQTVHDSHKKEDYAWREYLIDGDPLDFENWSYTGKTWDFSFRMPSELP